MTPAQIALVEQTISSIDVHQLAGDFYRRAFATDPTLTEMFTADPEAQRARFAAELTEVVRSVRTHDEFATSVRSLGGRHRAYGVRAVHYRLMGDVLLTGLASALGAGWTDEVEEAWKLAYNLTAETMMLGSLDSPTTTG